MSSKNGKPLEKWYYDACTLEGEETYKEIVNNRYHKEAEAVVSHLSLGEAYGNCFFKGEKKLNAFIDLINSLKGYVRIIGNDHIDEKLIKIKEILKLSITDAIHIATALNSGCRVLRTTDPDIYKIDKASIQKIIKEFEIPEFIISKMNGKK